MESGTWRMVVAMAMSGTIGALVVMSGQTPYTVVWFRCLIGGAALLGWLSWQRRWRPMNWRALAWLAAGGAALIINWICLFSAYLWSSISVATVVYHTQPFLLILLAMLQGERPAPRKMPWLVLAFMGVVLTAGLNSGGRNLLVGVGLALAAAFFYALATIATRQLKDYAPAQIAGVQLLFGALVLAPFAQFDLHAFTPQTWACLIVLGLVHTGLMYNLMYLAFQRLKPEALATLAFIYPVVAILVDLAVFHTSLSAMQMAGMTLILAAVLANQRVGLTRPG